MPSYVDYFLTSRADVLLLDLIEITHPAFTQPYRIVRNATAGVVATIDIDGEEVEAAFSYYPAKVKRLGASDDLEARIRIDLGDLGEVLPLELDAVAEVGAFDVKPTVRYWAFRSDDLETPVFGPVIMEMPKISSNGEGASFEAKAPSLNINRTGELYRMERFPMLRGLM